MGSGSRGLQGLVCGLAELSKPGLAGVAGGLGHRTLAVVAVVLGFRTAESSPSDRIRIPSPL